MIGLLPSLTPEQEPISRWVEWARNCRYQIAALAEWFGVSPRILTDFFTVLTDRTASEWIFEIRIWDAARLLCDGYCQEAIASELGFKSEVDVAVQFGRYFKYAPAEFILKHQRWAKKRCEGLNTPFKTDSSRDVLFEPPWTRAWRVLSPCARCGQGNSCQSLAPGKPLLAGCLHPPICRGANGAGDVLSELFWEELTGKLSVSFPAADKTLVSEAAADALIDYLERPDRFDPSRCTLDHFLTMVAWRNLANAIRDQRRRSARETAAARTFLDLFCRTSPFLGNYSTEETEEIEENASSIEQEMGLWDRFVAERTPGERRFIELWLKGERRTQAFAALMGIADRSAASRRKAVKRAKDRIKKALQRWRTES